MNCFFRKELLWFYAFLSACFVLCFQFYGLVVRQEERKLLVQRANELSRQKCFFEKNKSHLKKHPLQTTVWSRGKVMHFLKSLAKSEGLHTMRFKLIPVEKFHADLASRSYRLCIEMASLKDRQLVGFIDRCQEVLKGLLVPKSLTLSHQDIEQGDGELTQGLSGCYIFEIKMT